MPPPEPPRQAPPERRPGPPRPSPARPGPARPALGAGTGAKASGIGLGDHAVDAGLREGESQVGMKHHGHSWGRSRSQANTTPGVGFGDLAKLTRSRPMIHATVQQ